MTDRDGRLLFINESFARGANVHDSQKPAYPGDLVVAEDQADWRLQLSGVMRSARR